MLLIVLLVLQVLLLIAVILLYARKPVVAPVVAPDPRQTQPARAGGAAAWAA